MPDSSFYAPGGAGEVELQLNELTDVIIGEPSAGQSLLFDGTNWVNGTAPNSSMFYPYTPEDDYTYFPRANVSDNNNAFASGFTPIVFDTEVEVAALTLNVIFNQDTANGALGTRFRFLVYEGDPTSPYQRPKDFVGDGGGILLEASDVGSLFVSGNLESVPPSTITLAPGTVYWIGCLIQRAADGSVRPFIENNYGTALEPLVSYAFPAGQVASTGSAVSGYGVGVPPVATSILTITPAADISGLSGPSGFTPRVGVKVTIPTP